jgi:hypothetical protein
MRSGEYAYCMPSGAIASDCTRKTPARSLGAMGTHTVRAPLRKSMRAIVRFTCGHFDGRVAPKPRVAGAVDLAHASRAERGDDFVRPEPNACGESHSIT